MSKNVENHNVNNWPWESASKFSRSFPESSIYPRISIVTPSFNQAKTLETTIRSVIFQEYPNLEYIIMDGGSTDGSVEIIKKYAPKLAYWTSQRDQGQSHAINKGWLLSTGELVAWINSDDYLEPGVLQKVAGIYNQQKSKKIGLIYGKANIFDSHGKIISSIGEPFNLYFHLSNLINPIPQPSAFILMDCIKKIGFLDEELHYSMDFDLFLRIGLDYPLLFINEIWSNILYSPDTKTSQKPLDFLEDHKILLGKMKANIKYDLQIQKIINSAYASNYLRYARIYCEYGKWIAAITALFKGVKRNPIFLIRKLFRIFIRGRYSHFDKSIYGH